MNYKDMYKKKISEMLLQYEPGYGEYLKQKYSGYEHVCIWGCGNMGKYWPDYLKKYGILVDCYCDNNPLKWGTYPYDYGIKCISPDELLKEKDKTVVFIPTRYYKEIYCQLKKLGFPIIDRLFHGKFAVDDFLRENDINDVVKMLGKTIDILSDEESCRILSRLISEWTTNEYEYGRLDDICSLPQYFPRDIVHPRGDEVYVDCGAYIGDNIDDFLVFENEKFEKYYAFELNKKSFITLEENVKTKWGRHADKFYIENMGVSNNTRDIKYLDACEGSKITVEDANAVEGKVVALDDYFKNTPITFLKMDIEGAELDALNGAKSVISRDFPTLAICIYHKPDDFWRIPLFIKNNWPVYDIYIRHHTDLMTETVCYAVRKTR